MKISLVDQIVELEIVPVQAHFFDPIQRKINSFLENIEKLKTHNSFASYQIILQYFLISPPVFNTPHRLCLQSPDCILPN